MPESSLEKLLRLADASLLEPAALGDVHKDDDAHDFLMHSCSWYAQVDAGENATDYEHCQPATGSGQPPRLVVKLTPRTPEASTVDQPTVPPGGPGLFHIKGRHLPPYIQHLYKHLVGRYGKHEAYGVAVGIVKKWAQGVNPGGWKTKSGKGKRTHPDVRAAAAKNVAQWEQDKADAHQHHVHATALLPTDTGEGKILPLPPTPRKTAAMMTAHRVHDMCVSLAHASERMQAARANKDGALRGYEVIHIRNHLSRVMSNGHLLADNLRQNYPAEGKELDGMSKTLGLAKSLSPSIKAATTAHLLQTTLNESTHAVRHAVLMSKTEPRDEWEFNCDHSEKHLHSALEHACKLGQHLKDNYPEEGRLLTGLEEMAQGQPEVKAAALQDGPTITGEQANYRDADMPGQTCHTCLNRSGSSCRLVSVTTSPTYVCDSWEGMAELAAPAGWPSGRAYRKSFLSPPRDMPDNATVISAPGAGKPQYLYGQMKQEPSQTVSPSPPLPSSVPLPTPKELMAFAAQIGKMTDDEDHHLRGAVLHLTSASEKIENNPISALACLRSAQTALQQAWRNRVMQAQPRVAYVFSANTPPAEQSSQQQVWAKEQSKIGEAQAAADKIASFIDRIRRSYFGRIGMEHGTAGGGLAGQPNARL